MESRRRVSSAVMFISLFKLFIVFFLSVGVAQACVCDEQKIPDVADSYSKAKVVFAGTVIGRGKYGIWLKVTDSWKGARSKTIYLYTGNAINDCYALSYFMNGEDHWLIYGYLDPLYRSENSKRPYTYKLMSRACDRTKPLAYAADDVRALDKLRSARMAHATK
jgi:hypothetical protein